jgi:hypothetical protein
MGKKLINNTPLSDREFRRAREAYHKQKRDALNRKDRNGDPIEWHFTFDEWLDIWMKSGKWSQRGCRRGQYCMARFGDVGPYAPWNVEIKLHSENAREGNKGRSKPPISEEYRKKQSESHKGQIPWNKGRKGIPLSEEHRKKLSEATKGIPKPKLACVHCGKLCSANHLKRWHGDNCRHKV